MEVTSSSPAPGVQVVQNPRDRLIADQIKRTEVQNSFFTPHHDHAADWQLSTSAKARIRPSTSRYGRFFVLWLLSTIQFTSPGSVSDSVSSRSRTCCHTQTAVFCPHVP